MIEKSLIDRLSPLVDGRVYFGVAPEDATQPRLVIQTVSSIRYYLGSKYSEQWVTVPAGYLTDGASVPQLLWNLIPPWGSYGQAAVVHDLLCEYLAIVVAGELVSITRERCDEIFSESMSVLGVPEWKRWAIYQGVSMYRKLARIDMPSTIPLKRKLEATWHPVLEGASRRAR